MGVSLRSSSNDEGSSRVWTALLEQHSPSSPVFHNLRRFIDAVSPTAPTTGLPLQGNPMATADANCNNLRKELQPQPQSSPPELAGALGQAKWASVVNTDKGEGKQAVMS